MILRRLPMLAVAVVGIIVMVVVARDTATTVDPVFSEVASPWMPSAPAPGGLSSTWYCPGVPAGAPAEPAADTPTSEPAGDDTDAAAGESAADTVDTERIAGEVWVFNPDGDTMNGTITVLTASEDQQLVQPFSIPAYASHEFDIDELVDTPYAAAVVEIQGGGGLVEQRSTWPLRQTSIGESVAACTNSPASQWYFATGDTSEGSQDLIVLSNPHDHAAVVDIMLETSRGNRPIESFTVPAKSVRTIDLREHTVDDEINVGVSIVAARGSLVAGRAQYWDTESRDGYSMVLGAPALRNLWWFAAGENAESVTAEYAIFNPNDFGIQVRPIPLGFESPTDGSYAPPEPIPVGAGDVVAFLLSDVPNIPEGLVSMAFTSEEPSQTFVVERTLTRTIQGISTSSVTPGGTAREDGYVANTWYMGLGPHEATTAGLIVQNTEAVAATVTVQAIRADGVVNVEGLDAVALPDEGTVAIDIPESAVGVPLIVRSTSRVFVERVLPRESGAQGRVASWLVPAA
ncbi:DUF5719 family protein [Desertimonas flava]|uniref:DUF5719 family protein n=1 Tax=Desertimonas flava TaxID=2064846 RepID=UPI000E3512A9|nr:DUF5719 family protein [Desertimonas flava]